MTCRLNVLIAACIRVCLTVHIYSQAVSQTMISGPSPEFDKDNNNNKQQSHHCRHDPHHLLTLLLTSTALDTLSTRTLQMMLRDPALIVRLLRKGARRDGRSVGTNHGNLIFGIDSLLGPGGAGARTLTTLATTLGLREELFNPRLVHKVEGTRKASEEEEVEKNTVWVLVQNFPQA